MNERTPLEARVKRRLMVIIISGLATLVTVACSLLRIARNLRPDPMCYEPPPPTDDIIVTCYEAVEPTKTPMISPLDSPLPTPTPTPVCYTATPSPTDTPTPALCYIAAPQTPTPRATPTTEPESRDALRDRLLAEGRFPDEVARLIEETS